MSLFVHALISPLIKPLSSSSRFLGGFSTQHGLAANILGPALYTWLNKERMPRIWKLEGWFVGSGVSGNHFVIKYVILTVLSCFSSQILTLNNSNNQSVWTNATPPLLIRYDSTLYLNQPKHLSIQALPVLDICTPAALVIGDWMIGTRETMPSSLLLSRPLHNASAFQIENHVLQKSEQKVC